MEGPTPVSALIHAGDDGDGRRVHDRAQRGAVQPRAARRWRSSRSIGAATALLAGTIGLVQNDIKRVLAYSTVSQLGYMFLAMGVGAYAAGIFHLYTHAFFKALLFLGSGAVIHALAGEQDLRQHGRAEEGPADHLLDVPHRRARDCRRAGPRRVLQQGRDPLSDVRRAATRSLWVDRPADVAADGDLHVPPRVPGLPRRQRQQLRPSQRSASTRTALARTDTVHLARRAPAMAFALIVLAVGSVVAGYAGLPHALGGSNRFEQLSGAELRRSARQRRRRPRTAPSRADGWCRSRSRVAGIGDRASLLPEAEATPRGQLAERFAGVHRAAR